MRKRILLYVMAFVLPLLANAQGWPAHYKGVMLQGFYWDSYKETSWKSLTSQADELSKYFDLIWIPNSGTTSDFEHNPTATTMGYDPCFWLKHNSSFGTEDELREMIKTFRQKGTGFIADVVINHKNGLNDWCDFPEEDVVGKNTGKRYQLTWSLADICQNDECASQLNKDGTQKYPVTGAKDTGDNFDGFRDLDHTSAHVQHNVDVYLDFLLNELGYAGFRYDMVKGYGAQYIKIYNEASQPDFSVGEYWDNTDNVAAWIRSTGLTSAAFDFGLKYAINDYFGGGDWNIISKGNAADASLSRYAVTFVDNHDTYREESMPLKNNILAANAFILALPGTPCLFWPHWVAYKEELKKMIDARKEAGVSNTSQIVHQAQHGDGYVTVVRGDNRDILVTSGYPTDIEDMLKDYNPVSTGTAENPNYGFYISKTKPSSGGEEEDPEEGYTIYVSASSAPYLYAWEGKSTTLNGGWPGTLMTKTCTIDGKKFYYKKLHPTESTFNIIFNLGNSQPQTVDITGLVSDVFYEFDPSIKNSDGKVLPTDVTDTYKGKTPILDPDPEPETEKPSYEAGEVCAFFEAPTSTYPTAYAYAWTTTSAGTTWYTEKWPGEKCTFVKTLSNGNNLWKWTYTKVGGEPENIIFNAGSDSKTQTADLGFVAGGYYTPSGLSEIILPEGATDPVQEISSREFTAKQFATLCLPYDVSAGEMKDLGGAFYKYSSESDGVLYFSVATSLRAWHPYVYIASQSGQNWTSLAEKTTETGTPLRVKHGDFTFVGTATKKNLISDAALTYYGYRKADGTFSQVGTSKGANIGAWKAYFSTPTVSGAEAKVSYFEGGNGGTATDIHAVKRIIDSTSEDVYTIDGKKMGSKALPQGLYIYKGKKLIVK